MSETVLSEAAVARDLAKLREKSETLSGNQKLCLPLVARLDGLFEVIKAVPEEARQRVVDKFLDTISKFLTLLRVHNHYKYLLFWLANSQRLVGQINQFHTRVDEIYTDLGVVEDAELSGWQAKQDQGREEQKRWFTSNLNLWSEAMLVNDVPNPSKLKEILTTMQTQLELRTGADKNQEGVEADTTAEMIDLMQKTFDRVNRFTDVHLGEAFPWFVPAEDIKRDSGKDAEPFKVGTFGQLYKGTWMNAWDQTEIPVAIKQLIQLNGLDDNSRFSRELATWSTLRHENILEMLGANHVSRIKFFISKYATEGNFDDFFSKSEKSEAHRKLLWHLFGQAATGLKFLHDNKVEHGGLKTTNLLVTRKDGKLVAMVSDFGMAIVRTESVSVSFHARSEMVRWKAPERLVQAADAVDFHRADTYSLGLCLIDAATGEPPYGTDDDDMIITSKLNSEPIERPEGAFSDDEWALVSSMIDNNPENRPTLDEVIKRMAELDAVRQQDAAAA